MYVRIVLYRVCFYVLCVGLGDAEMIAKLAEIAKTNGKNNVSFVCYMLLGKLEKCLDLLIETDRIPEAAFFARWIESFIFETRHSSDFHNCRRATKLVGRVGAEIQR